MQINDQSRYISSLNTIFIQIFCLFVSGRGDFSIVIIVALMKMLLLAITDHVLQQPYRVNLKPNVC